MNRFYLLRDILTKKNLIILYTSLIESIINYCILAWGGTFSSIMNPLQVAQNTILKIILKKNRLYSTQKIYQETQVLKVRSIFVYRCLRWTQMNLSELNLRNSAPTRSVSNLQVKIPLMHKTLVQKSVFFLGPKLYNLLPNSLREISNNKEFRVALREYLRHDDEDMKWSGVF